MIYCEECKEGGGSFTIRKKDGKDVYYCKWCIDKVDDKPNNKTRDKISGANTI